MKHLSPLLEALIEHLQCLPGVGRKSAQRMALHLLERDREGGRQLGQALLNGMNHVRRCTQCRIHAEASPCPLCEDARRDTSLLCVVETPADVLAIEQTGYYRGQYYVLHGRISPLDGVGPQQLGFSGLMALVSDRQVKEVIVATSMTPEGEATAHYLVELLREWDAEVGQGVQVSRIAHGVPIGGDIDLVNGTTLSYALSERKLLNASTSET